MSLQLGWEEELDENALVGFDFYEWIKSHNDNVDNTNNKENNDAEATNSKTIETDNNPIEILSDSDSNPSNKLQCPICNEICDTIKALQFHCDSCSDSTSTQSQTTHNIEQQKTKQRQQKQWKDILNMNINKKRIRNTSNSDDISYKIPHKKRKITTMTKKHKISNKYQMQTTLDDIYNIDQKQFKRINPKKSCKNKKNLYMDKVNTVTPGFDIDLFPAESDCIETDEKSDELQIKQILKDSNIDNKMIKRSFLDLNGMNKTFDSSITMEHTQDITENVALTQAVNSSKKKKKKAKEHRKEIKFIPPWEMK